MKIMQTKYNETGPIQIQDHGVAFLVSYPATERGYQLEKVFSKVTDSNAWNKAQKFAAEKLNEGTST